MKKLRLLLSAVVITAIAATTVITTTAAIPEGSKIGLNLLPESVDELYPGNGSEDGYIPELDDNGLSLTYTEAGEANGFVQVKFTYGEAVNLNNAPNIRLKTHFTRTDPEENPPRVNLRVNYTTSSGESNYIMISQMTDLFETNNGSINTDLEATINFFELLYKNDLLTPDGVVIIDEVSYWMGGDAGLVLTYDYLYFEEGTPTIDGQETSTSELFSSTSSAASTAASGNASSAASSSRASSSSRTTNNNNDDNMVMWIVIGVAAAVVIIVVIVLIVVKTKKSGASEESADDNAVSQDTEETAEEKSEDNTSEEKDDEEK